MDITESELDGLDLIVRTVSCWDDPVSAVGPVKVHMLDTFDFGCITEIGINCVPRAGVVGMKAALGALWSVTVRYF